MDQIRELIRSNVPEERFEHIQNVEKTAVELARRYGINEKKAALSALLHDAMRGRSDQELLVWARECGVDVDAYSQRYPSLLHGPLAAFWAQHTLGIDDKEVLSAVCAHTVGDNVMAPLTCVLYLADAMEPGRDYPGVEEVREEAKHSLYTATRLAVVQSEQHLKEKGRTPHPNSAHAIDALEKAIKEEKTVTQSAKELALYIARTLDDKKAKDIQLIDISKLSILADCFVVASGSNPLQVRALCDDVKEALAKRNIPCIRIDGYAAGRWIVMDATDVLVHIFHWEEREFYNLERLWNDGTNTYSYERTGDLIKA